jgi:Gene Transfer Agent (GTA)-like protein/putative tail protein
MVAFIISELASAIGHSIGGSAGASIGLGLGSILGKQIENSLFNDSSGFRIKGSRLADLNIQTSTYGKTIPIVYGTAKISGNIIWAKPLNENKYIDKNGSITYSGYKYFATFALAICEGEIDSVLRVWADEKQIDPYSIKYTLYKGGEEQTPNPAIEKHEGVGNVPAYRGLAYVVFEDFPLEEYGNRIPNFSFEVKRAVFREAGEIALEDVVSAVNIIPGSGEFVYDTRVQTKVSGNYIEGHWIQKGKGTKINQNNRANKADAVVSLDQLQETCSNLEWAAPVVSWFATSLDLAECKIKAGIEYKDDTSTTPNLWSVADYNRGNAYEITKDENGDPVYGGTCSDESILRYLDELCRRNIKIMFYPMFFMDTEGKPWRGRLTGEASAVKTFFNKPEGYNQFVLHYAKLVKGKVDAFIIGSELIGLTKIKDQNNNFPAVEELIHLAKKVKEIMGEEVKISYAADWSEYHHAEGGWYNLDPLWASEHIDFIGIDAYFPLTNATANITDEKQITDGWSSGEGYDFYYEGDDQKPLSQEYAWKNIDWWWSNHHKNPDGKQTKWQPKSKKIWFTEFGFPSVDLCSNQPNVFYDPKSSENALPKHSRGRVDYLAQRTALRATLQYWQDSEMVEEMFIWCWDARPYPYFPDLSRIWNDGNCHSKGHWINGKLGLSTLRAVVKDICLHSSFSEKEIDVSKLEGLVHGFVIGNQSSARDAIEVLQSTYFFDCAESGDSLKFISKKYQQVISVDSNDIVVQDYKLLSEIKREPEPELPAKVEVMFINRLCDYQLGLKIATRQITYSKAVESINLPLVLGTSQAQNIANVTLYNRWLERNSYDFTLPVKYAHIKPTNIIEIKDDKSLVTLRVTGICFQDSRKIKVSAVSEDISIYDADTEGEGGEQALVTSATSTIFYILELPNLPFDRDNKLGVYFVACGKEENWPGAVVICPDGRKIYLNNNTLGYILNVKNKEIELSLINGKLANEALALIGNEVVEFKLLEQQEEYIYKIALEKEININPGDRFILLDQSIIKYELPESVIGKEEAYKLYTIGQNEEEAKEYKFTLKSQTT